MSVSHWSVVAAMRRSALESFSTAATVFALAMALAVRRAGFPPFWKQRADDQFTGLAQSNRFV